MTQPHDDPVDHLADLDLDDELARTDDVLAPSLAQLFAPPADLETRTQREVTTSLMSRSLLGTGADLLTVGWQTVRFLFNPTDGTTTDDEEEVAQ